MFFNSWTFALFLVTVFCVYHVLRCRAQNVLLVAASYVFYGWWDWRFLSLLLISTIVDFTVARAMSDASTRRRKLLLAISVCTNLGILGFFKYFGFFMETAAVAMRQIGLEPDWPTLRIILPVGISFYTFQTMAYTIDVYRKKLSPTRNLLTFAVYVAFFPQLVAGPIERAQRLLPQIAGHRTVTAHQFSSGILLILIGLCRKVAIADLVAGDVEYAFSNYETLGGAMLARGLFLFALQIYGDFAGYSDIARGTSRLLGIELMRNFEQPYFSTSITEFWRRWHVSLSTWLRDYLYVSLGGNRVTKLLVYRNLMLTMLLGGLWHGAAWTFVIWGAIHGVALIMHKAWLSVRSQVWPSAQTSSASGRIAGLACGWVITMLVIICGWAFFRAPDLTTAVGYLGTMFSEPSIPTLRQLVLPVGVTALLLAIDLPQRLTGRHTVLLEWPWPLRGSVYACLVLIMVLVRSGDEVPFIYFQF